MKRIFLALVSTNQLDSNRINPVIAADDPHLASHPRHPPSDMGKGPSGAGDTPARGAGVMSISSALDAAKAEFARNVKDSEEVMETLEVTSLAEIREVSAEIVAQNRENARRVLEKASATVGGGAWVSPTSGDALVAPLAGSRRAADKAKRRSSKTRDASGKDKDKSDGPRSANVSEPSPLAKALNSPSVMPMKS